MIPQSLPCVVICHAILMLQGVSTEHNRWGNMSLLKSDIWKTELQREMGRETEREISLLQVHFHMATMVSAEPSRSQQPGCPSRSSTRAAEAITLGPPIIVFPGILAGRCTGSRAAGLAVLTLHESFAGGSLPWCLSAQPKTFLKVAHKGEWHQTLWRRRAA